MDRSEASRSEDLADANLIGTGDGMDTLLGKRCIGGCEQNEGFAGPNLHGAGICMDFWSFGGQSLPERMQSPPRKNNSENLGLTLHHGKSPSNVSRCYTRKNIYPNELTKHDLCNARGLHRETVSRPP